jgi:hypothetical protein
MFEQMLSNADEGDWFILGFGAAVGVLWSVVSLLFVASDAWSTSTWSSWSSREQAIYTALLWPAMAAWGTHRTLLGSGSDMLTLTFGYGIVSGVIGGLLFTLCLRRIA